jgi:hypothetical protein
MVFSLFRPGFSRAFVKWDGEALVTSGSILNGRRF